MAPSPRSPACCHPAKAFLSAVLLLTLQSLIPLAYADLDAVKEYVWNDIQTVRSKLITSIKSHKMAVEIRKAAEERVKAAGATLKEAKQRKMEVKGSNKEADVKQVREKVQKDVDKVEGDLEAAESYLQERRRDEADLDASEDLLQALKNFLEGLGKKIGKAQNDLNRKMKH